MFDNNEKMKEQKRPPKKKQRQVQMSNNGNGRNGFVRYENDCNKVWIYKLEESYSNIGSKIFKHTTKKLKTPLFEINEKASTKWGSWNPNTRVMSISASLLRNFEWGAVEHVMKHEIAHQIVSEIFNADCYGVAHGELWKEACKIVRIAPTRCNSANFLSSFKGSESSPMVEKIRKLLIHANDSGATKKEAEIFMRKAKELMLRHDIATQYIMGASKAFVTRPIGPLFKRWQSYMWRLGDLLTDNYNVKCIRTYGPNGTKRLELFGEPDNLDIAEYVGHALLNQAERLYLVHKNDFNRKNSYNYGRRLSKRAFIEGLIHGYSQKLLNDQKDAIDRVEVSVAKEYAKREGRSYVEGDRAIIPAYNKKLLEEMYGKAYPCLRMVSNTNANGNGWTAGEKAGGSLRLAKGISNNGNRSKLLTLRS